MSRWVWFTITTLTTLLADMVFFAFIALGIFGAKFIILGLLFNIIMGVIIHMTLDF